MALFYFICMHFCKHLIVALILLCSLGFAQEPLVDSVSAVDSIAYYEDLADYNYKKFRSDETLAEVFFWIGVGSGVAAPILVFAAAGAADCYGYEGCQEGNLALTITAFTTLALVPVSWIAYGGFSAMKLVRHRKYDKYYWKKEELKKQRELEKSESVNLQVQVLPLLNPLDGRYGAALAFSF